MQAGLATVPMALMTWSASPLSGRIVGRRGPRLPLADRRRLPARRRAPCSTGLDPTTPLAWLLAAYVVFGIGFGFVNAPITNAAVSGMPRAQAGVAAAIATTSRQFGQTLGVAVVGAIVASRAGGSADARARRGEPPGLVDADGLRRRRAACSAWWPRAAGRRRRPGARPPSSIPRHCCHRLDAMSAATTTAAPATPRARSGCSMQDLVLDNQRRREVSEALGHELRPRPRGAPHRPPADVDGRAGRGARHRPPQRDRRRRRPREPWASSPPAAPDDRRAKLVEATRKGKDLARRANEILATPPAALSSLGNEDLEALRRLLTSITPR